MGLDVSKLSQSLGVTKKFSDKAAKKMETTVSQLVQNSEKKLMKTLECKALQGKIPAKILPYNTTVQKEIFKQMPNGFKAFPGYNPNTKLIGTTPATIKALATESIQQGATVDEAINGAKAVIAAVGEQSGIPASKYARVFEEKGLTEFEKKLNKEEAGLDKFLKKMELMRKYGDKLEAKHKAEQIVQNLQELDTRLQK